MAPSNNPPDDVLAEVLQDLIARRLEIPSDRVRVRIQTGVSGQKLIVAIDGRVLLRSPERAVVLDLAQQFRLIFSS